MGAEIEDAPGGGDLGVAEALFGEGPSTVVLSAAPENVARLRDLFPELECRVVGRVVAEPGLRFASLIDEDLRELRRIYEQAIPKRLDAHD